MANTDSEGETNQQLAERLYGLLISAHATGGVERLGDIEVRTNWRRDYQPAFGELVDFLRKHPKLYELNDDATAVAVRKVDDEALRKKKKRRPAKLAPLLQRPPTSFNRGQVCYLCIADEFSLEEIASHYQRQQYSTHLAFDVLHVTTRSTKYGTGGHSFDLFVFQYGVVVWWGLEQRFFSLVETDFLSPASKINKAVINRYQQKFIHEEFPVWFPYSIDDREENTHEPDELFLEQLKYDHFLIPKDSIDVKLCTSHALAQSAKIDFLEVTIAELTDNCKPLPKELKEKGSVTISERRLLQLRGEVLFYRLMLKSGSDLLDEPELFWEHPWLKPFYHSTKEEFEISQRVQALDAKLDAAQEILQMIADQFHQRHGSRLEWIVIWLVMVEVVIGILELILDLRPWLAPPVAAAAHK